MHLGRYACHAAGKNLARLGGELGKELGVAHINGTGGDVNATTGHCLVAGAETDTTLNALEFGNHNAVIFLVCGGLTHLAVQSAALQEGVELNLLQTTGGALALLVTSRYIARGGFTLCLGFCAFQDDDISRHNCDVVDLRAPILHYSSDSSSENTLSMSFCSPEKPTWSEFLAI